MDAAPAEAERVDVAIVGGGPAGAYAALRLKRLHPGANIVVFERMGSVGGSQIAPLRGSGGDGSVSWVKHDTHSSTEFDPSVSTLLCGVSNELGLGIKPVHIPKESQDVFYFRGKAYAPRTSASAYSDEKDSSSIGDHPERVIEKCVESFFLDYPEGSRPPFVRKATQHDSGGNVARVR